MAETYGPFGLSYEDEQQRLHNLAICEKFMTIEGPARNEQRYPFCTDTGGISLPFGREQPKSQNFLSKWKDLAQTYADGGFDFFPEWWIHSGKIHSTPDPDFFLIECDGESLRYDPRFPEVGYYKNHYMLLVEFVDGKLHNMDEVFNPAAVYINYGWNREPEMF